ncbi:OLC1v1021860C1 [Oldenlandia corymbosa var. corymbosa]|uniref:OLC1v1021860C1 n=1 Tax=Oldenlandia corymbosa var. corymbosa TaxID=529605 RepID=A0AAV1BWM5_OLDCO|nr:OLC1v1021860C1 [Oldenlandia corymbosa var. corymbosa]
MASLGLKNNHQIIAMLFVLLLVHEAAMLLTSSSVVAAASQTKSSSECCDNCESTYIDCDDLCCGPHLTDECRWGCVIDLSICINGCGGGCTFLAGIKNRAVNVMEGCKQQSLRPQTI